MTANLSPLPIQAFLDNNGKQLSGGKLFTYAAGTTSKLTTYTDASGGTPNTNPVILNTRGEAPVWFAAGQSYKFVLSPPTDTDPPTNPFWTVDNLLASPASVTSIGGMTGVITLGPGLTGISNVLSAILYNSYLSGYQISMPGLSSSFGVNPGVAVDSTNANLIILTGSISKTTSAWSLRSGGGALDVGTIANSTWYSVYAIERTDTGNVDILASLAPNTTATITVTIATPGVVTWTNHGLQANTQIVFTTTGALPTGITAGTTYYVKTVLDVNTFQISATQGGAAINTTGTQSGTHTGTSNPTLPASYNLFRYLGMMKTDGSAHWTLFTQQGDEFLWGVPTQDFSVSNQGATAILYALNTPPGRKTNALGLLAYENAANVAVLPSSPDTTDTLPAVDGIGVTTKATAYGNLTVSIRTNTSQQVRMRASAASTILEWTTQGWIDRRGRDA